MSVQRIVVASLALLSLPCVAANGAETLATLLATVSEAARPATPLRADAAAELNGLEGRKRDHLVFVERSAGAHGPPQVYVQLDEAKIRVLALDPSDLRIAREGKGEKVAADAAVGSTSFTVEDFLPFSPARCAATRLAEITAEQFALVCEPKKPPSQYSLMVYKFDREKSALLQVLLYKGAMTNLVKMLRNADFVQVGGTWRPKRVVMQDFKLRTRDVLSLQWQAVAQLPSEAFDPTAFAAIVLPKAPFAKP